MTSWPWVTLIWHKPTKVLEGYFEVSHTRFMSFHRFYFSLIRLFCQAKSAMTDNQKFGIWHDLWRHQWPSDKILQHIRKVKVRSIQNRLRIENRSSCLTDSRGGGAKRPPPHWRVESGDTPSVRGLTRAALGSTATLRWLGGGGRISPILPNFRINRRNEKREAAIESPKRGDSKAIFKFF